MPVMEIEMDNDLRSSDTPFIVRVSKVAACAITCSILGYLILLIAMLFKTPEQELLTWSEIFIQLGHNEFAVQSFVYIGGLIGTIAGIFLTADRK